MATKATLHALPSELITLIFSFLPKTSLPSVRLVSHKFNHLSFTQAFAYLPHWLSYETSHSSIISLAHDVFNRPAVMWSPWAVGPDEPVDNVWLGVVWRFLVKTDPPGMQMQMGDGEEGDNGEGREVLTAENFARLSGRVEVTENRLRTGQNRLKMWKSYTELGAKIW